MLDQGALLHAVGNLGHDDLVDAAGPLLLLPGGAQAHPAPAGLVGFLKRGARLHDHPARGEVRPGRPLHQVGGGAVRALQEIEARVDQLARIVRRDRAGHADRDAAGAVRQEVREGRRHDHRLGFLAVVGGPEVDRVLVQAHHQELGGGGQPTLRVAHGRGVIAVDVAEVALAIHERRTLGEVLRQAHQGVVDRLVAVRMVGAHHVADHLGAFARCARWAQPQLAHGVEYAALHRLQPVANVRQRPVDDGRQSVGEIAAAERLGQGLLDDAAAILRGRRRRNVLGHP